MSISVVNLPSLTEYVNLVSLSGLDEDESLIVRNNTSTTAFIIQAVSQPSDSAVGYPILTGETLLIHNNFTPVWIKGGTGPFIVQELTSTITPFTGVDLPESVYSSTIEALRRVKVSSEPSVAAGVLHGATYAVSGSFSVAAGDFIAMNISPASDVLIHKVTTNQNLVFDVYNQHATGTADGIFLAKNLNLISDDVSPAQGQLYTPATPVGDIIYSGISEDNPYIIASFLKKPAVVVKNTTGGIATIKITIIFEEFGPREASFGLTASTLLLSNTEMSTFG